MGFLRRTSPLVKEMFQVAAIMGCGDVVAQMWADEKQLTGVNWERTAKFAGLGFILVAPALRKWYGAMERMLSQNQPRYRRTLKKVALDQCCFAPVFTAIVTTSVNGLNGLSMQDNLRSLKEKYIPILKANYTVWPLAQVINFTVLPLRSQVIFAQCVALFWNTYLSLKINAKP